MVEGWNKWRENNRSTRIDLSGADLTGADLSRADLTGANLSGTTLSRATLISTNFSGANLSGATLTQADLTGADLIGADLNGANLNGITLSRAILIGATLISANLSGTILSGATLGSTLFEDVDLSQVKGLETVRHFLPSRIAIDTIYKSKGNIPEVFLRGCGVPDNLIAFMHSLTGKAFDFYSCFISHSTQDKDFAERIYADLQSKGVRCWFAPEDLKIGDKFRTCIDEAIRIYDKLMIVLSENSINSEWVEKEVETAFEKERQQKRTMLFPVRLDDAVMKADQAWAADIRRTRHIGDMSNWKDHDSYQKAFDRLLRDLQAENVKK